MAAIQFTGTGWSQKQNPRHLTMEKSGKNMIEAQLIETPHDRHRIAHGNTRK